MVSGPLVYEWSSARANIGLDSDDVLRPHAEYIALGTHIDERHRAYRELLAAGDDATVTASLREATNGGYPLVGDRMKAQLEASGARIERGKPGPRKPPE